MELTEKQIRKLIREAIFETLSENEMEEATYPSSFNMDEFKALNSFPKRVNYCRERLTFLGKGSSRIVFQIDNDTVLKLAWNKKGVAQNQAEAAVKDDYYLNSLDLFAEVYDVDENYLWIEMQLARKVKKSDFKRLTGFDFNTFYYWVNDCYNRSVAYANRKMPIPEEYKELFKYGSQFYENFEYSIFDEVEEYIGNYGVEGIGDLQRISSWGIVGEAGKERLVLVDNGLSNDVLDNYYKK